ncbi:hypothetical protein MHI18_04455 [Peribacillus sp. FSL H8-0477]|uniref:hypothetical protein n=1 Tax=Peribacillus sp. FSL H8-0477 TaxID=2921388 RepID=UPI0030F7C42D
MNSKVEEFYRITKALSSSYECIRGDVHNEKGISGLKEAEENFYHALAFHLQGTSSYRQE